MNIAFNCTIGQKDLRHGADSEVGRRIILMVPPDPARIIGEGGISKSGAKEFIHFHARKSLLHTLAYVPLRSTKGDLRWLPRQWRWLRDLSDKELDRDHRASGGTRRPIRSALRGRGSGEVSDNARRAFQPIKREHRPVPCQAG